MKFYVKNFMLRFLTTSLLFAEIAEAFVFLLSSLIGNLKLKKDFIN